MLDRYVGDFYRRVPYQEVFRWWETVHPGEFLEAKESSIYSLVVKAWWSESTNRDNMYYRLVRRYCAWLRRAHFSDLSSFAKPENVWAWYKKNHLVEYLNCMRNGFEVRIRRAPFDIYRKFFHRLAEEYTYSMSITQFVSDNMTQEFFDRNFGTDFISENWYDDEE